MTIEIVARQLKQYLTTGAAIKPRAKPDLCKYPTNHSCLLQDIKSEKSQNGDVKVNVLTTLVGKIT